MRKLPAYLILPFVLVLTGCTPTFRVELGSPEMDPKQLAWQKAITEEINDHELRIQDLEKEIRNAQQPN